MRKIYASLAALAAFTTFNAHSGNFIVGNLQYSTLSDSTVAVSKYLTGYDIVIPDSVTDPNNEELRYEVAAIGLYAFKDANITSVVVPGTVKYLERYSFWGSTVQKVELGEGIESLGYGTFNVCEDLREINIPRSLKVLGKMSPVTGLEGSVFYGCISLREITLPGTLDSIPNLNFRACANLEKVVIEEGITKLGERVFEECSALREVQLPSTITEIGRGVFQSSGIVNPTFPGSVKVLPNSCYLWCRDMTAFTIEEGVEEIGRQAFADCRNYTDITIPNSVEFIRTDAFQGNEHVKTITIGSGIRRLGNACFAVWAPDMETNTPHWDLTDITIHSTVPPVYEANDEHIDELTADFFFGGSEFTDELRAKFFETVTLHVPEGSAADYAAADIWKEFKNVVEFEPASVETIVSSNDIRLEGNVAYASAPLTVYSTTGNLVATSTAGSIDLSSLARGIYIVRAGNSSIKVSI